MREISLEKNKTEAQSKGPQAGNGEVTGTVSSACRGQWAPKGHQRAAGYRCSRCFFAPIAHLRDRDILGECQSQSFQRPILPGRHEHISASEKQIRIKYNFLCLALFKEANVPVGEAVPGALPACKMGKPLSHKTCLEPRQP